MILLKIGTKITDIQILQIKKIPDVDHKIIKFDIFKIVYFASIFIKILVCGFLVKSLSSFGIRVILAS
jgi:hypothetical protein